MEIMANHYHATKQDAQRWNESKRMEYEITAYEDSTVRTGVYKCKDGRYKSQVWYADFKGRALHK